MGMTFPDITESAPDFTYSITVADYVSNYAAGDSDCTWYCQSTNPNFQCNNAAAGGADWELTFNP